MVCSKGYNWHLFKGFAALGLQVELDTMIVPFLTIIVPTTHLLRESNESDCAAMQTCTMQAVGEGGVQEGGRQHGVHGYTEANLLATHPQEPPGVSFKRQPRTPSMTSQNILLNFGRLHMYSDM